MPCVCLFLYVTVTGTPQMFHRALQPHGCAPPQGWKHQPAHRFSEDLTPQRWAPAVPGTGIFLQRHLFSVTFSGEFLGLVENRFWQLLNKGYRRRKFQTLHMWKCFHLIMKLFFTSGLARDFPAGSHFFTSVLESVFLWVTRGQVWSSSDFWPFQGWVSSPWKLSASLNPFQFRCFVAMCLCSCSSVVLGLWSANSLNLESHIH